MSRIPIHTELTTEALAAMRPGHGWFAARLASVERKDLPSLIRKALAEMIPVLTSFGRRSPYIEGPLSGRIFAAIRAEVEPVYEYARKHTDRDLRMPTINMAYLSNWCMKLGLDTDEVLAQLGVANRSTRVWGALTSRTGIYLVVEHSSEELTKAFAAYWRSKVGKQIKPLELMVDIAICIALNRLDRVVMYRQLMKAMQLPCNETRKADIAVVYEGLHTDIDIPAQEILITEPRYRSGQRVVMPSAGRERRWEVLSSAKGVTVSLAGSVMFRPMASKTWNEKEYKTIFDELYD